MSAGLLTAVAGIFLSGPTTVHATGVLSLPLWYPFEMGAIGLYYTGIRQETSDPADAAKTLLQARRDSTTAIMNGGGGNPFVMHNDLIIARALGIALADAASKPETLETQQNTESMATQKSGGYSVARAVSHRMPVITVVTSTRHF